MWKFVILALLFLQYGVTTQFVCDEDPVKFCKGDKVSFQPLPLNIKDLETTCSHTAIFDCYERYMKSCPSEAILIFNSVGDFESNIKLIREICQKDNKLHNEFQSHAKCIDSVTEKVLNTCRIDAENKHVEYIDFLLVKFKEDELDKTTIRHSDYYVRPSCLKHSYILGCLLTSIEDSCGDSAYLLVLEMVRRSRIVLRYCDVKEILNLDVWNSS